jgi:predicted amidohydrolase
MYLVACAAAGTQAGLEMSGHSMVVDPWGEIVAEAGPEPTVLHAEIEFEQVAETRAKFPVLRDRKLGVPAPR